MSAIELVEKSQLAERPAMKSGDTVRVHVKVREGDKERIQVFSGTVIMKKGTGVNETFTVRRIVNNEGVERIFPLHSPFVARVAVKRSGETRRAKLFYLRKRVGKAVRLAEVRKTTAKQEPQEGGSSARPELAAAAS